MGTPIPVYTNPSPYEGATQRDKDAARRVALLTDTRTKEPPGSNWIHDDPADRPDPFPR